MMVRKKSRQRKGLILRAQVTVYFRRKVTYQVRVFWTAKVESSRKMITWEGQPNKRWKGLQRSKDRLRCLVLSSEVELLEFLTQCINQGLGTGYYWILLHLFWRSLQASCLLLVNCYHLSRLRRCMSSAMSRWENGVSTWFHSLQLCATTAFVWFTLLYSAMSQHLSLNSSSLMVNQTLWQQDSSGSSLLLSLCYQLFSRKLLQRSKLSRICFSELSLCSFSFWVINWRLKAHQRTILTPSHSIILPSTGT